MNRSIFRLRSLLAEKGLPLEKAARIVGCSVTQLWRWIHGRSNPGEMSLLAIKRAIRKIERLSADQDLRWSFGTPALVLNFCCHGIFFSKIKKNFIFSSGQRPTAKGRGAKDRTADSARYQGDWIAIIGAAGLLGRLAPSGVSPCRLCTQKGPGWKKGKMIDTPRRSSQSKKRFGSGVKNGENWVLAHGIFMRC